MFDVRYGVRVISRITKDKKFLFNGGSAMHTMPKYTSHLCIFSSAQPKFLGNFFTRMHLFVISARNREDIVSTRMNENEF